MDNPYAAFLNDHPYYKTDHEISTIPAQKNVNRKYLPQIKFLYRRVDDNYLNGIHNIKVPSNLSECIQRKEKLFMCFECNKIYSENEYLLEQKMVCDNNGNTSLIIHKEEKSEKLCVNNIKKVENEKIINYGNTTVQSKCIFDCSTNLTKQNGKIKDECIICHSIFPDIEEHLKIVHPNYLNKTKVNNYICYQCDIEFDVEQKLLAHNLSIHKIRYSCSACEHYSVNRYQKTPLKTYSKNKCNANYVFSNELRKVHLIKRISFKSGFSNSKKTVFEVPKNKIKYFPIKPPKLLNQSSTVIDYFKKDINKVNINQNVTRDYQTKYAKNYKNNKLSLLDSNINKNKDHPINTDLTNIKLEVNYKKTDQQQTIYQRNQVYHTTCRICNNVVAYSKIALHMKLYHNNAPPYQCIICNAMFNFKYFLDKHRKEHVAIELYK